MCLPLWLVLYLGICCQVKGSSGLISGLQHWAHQVGIRSLCRLETDNHGGYRLVANSDIPPGEVFLEVPFDLCFSPTSLQRHPQLKQFRSLEWPTQLAVQLLLEKWEPQSVWTPYIRMLPTKQRFLTLPHHWDEACIEPWDFPDLLDGHQARLNFIESEWMNLQALVGLSEDSDDFSALRDYEEFQWALDCVATRNIRLEVNDTEVNVLVPLLDFMNHNSCVNSLFSISSDGCFIQVCHVGGQGILRDQEVFLNYGRLGAMKALSDYGFIPPTSSDDVFALVIPRKLYTQHLLMEMRETGGGENGPLALLRELGIQYSNSFYVSAKSVPEELIIALRVLLANPEEMSEARKSFLSIGRVGKLSDANEMQVQRMMVDEMVAPLDNLKVETEESLTLEGSNEFANSLLAKLHERRRKILLSAVESMWLKSDQ